jgi:two-component system, OmpR family, response regulator
MRILYVDDEADIREVAGLALGLNGELEVEAVGSGAEAISLLESNQFRPDALLLDVMMPGMDGPTLLQAIRALPAYAATPVVFITARAQREEQNRLLGLGAVGVITKPFDPMALAGELLSLLEPHVG